MSVMHGIAVPPQQGCRLGSRSRETSAGENCLTDISMKNWHRASAAPSGCTSVSLKLRK